ncbi:MAG: DUF1015 domain-containing protein [Pseudohongiellaceae bacterium]
MKLIKPFRGLRPHRELAAQLASHPYDVLNRQEATALAKDNPHSFLHINKPEVDVDPALDVYDPAVYATGAKNLQRFIDEGIMQRDEQETYYVYQQTMGAHQQIGLVAIASLDAYEDNLIKKHEFTRPDKEDDRVHHMDALGAQVGPVFLTYQADAAIDALIAQAVSADPEYDFEADYGTRHTFWLVEDSQLAAKIDAAFNKLPCLYVADGHHRSAAARRVRQLYQERNSRNSRKPAHTGEESYDYFLVVLFPHNQVQILDYNRLLQDLNGNTPAQFLTLLEKHFTIEPRSREQAKPTQAQEFGLYLSEQDEQGERGGQSKQEKGRSGGGQWYLLKPKAALLANIDDANPKANLDISILQDAVFTPLLNIKDQRIDKRVDFVGGIRGLEELERRINEETWQAAFALYPTSVESLMAIADANEVMPPKSTWFEPKLKSGLVVHMLD